MKDVWNQLRRFEFRPYMAYVALGALNVLFVGGLFWYQHTRIVALSLDIERLAMELASTTGNFFEKTAVLDERASDLSSTLSAAEKKIAATESGVDTVRSQVGSVEQAVGTITGTVSTLEKLSKTDPELLQKYSKIFFLNEHYAPERVSEIDRHYLYSENNPEVVHANVLPYLHALLEATKSQGIPLYVKSAYRSFDEQRGLKSAYSVTYGAGTANTFSADQGYSEHQLGTAVDFITTGLDGTLDGFDSTAAYQWMLQNAHRYGFTLSYPQGNAYYIFEPWHWRFVGIKLTTYLFEQKKHFYDLDQREIDAYLVDLF